MTRTAQSTSRSSLPAASVLVDELDVEGRGIARTDGKTVLIEGALPGERVVYRRRRRARHAEVAETCEVREPVPERAVPPCAHYAVCGGCRLQHLDHPAQVAFRQRMLLAALDAEAGLVPDEVLAPITGPPIGYRRRARLAVKHVPGKGGVLVGFREKFSSKVAVLERCEVLHPAIGAELAELRRCLGTLEARGRIPQLEVAVGDDAVAVVLRHLDPLSGADRDALAELARARGWHMYLQAGGPDDIEPLWPASPTPLTYRLAEQDVELAFGPTDFVQVNAAVNQSLVTRVLERLAPRPGDRVLDLFCGIGNFTLPLARHAARVTGVEASSLLVERARENARRNHIGNVDFACEDLARPSPESSWRHDRWDAMLLDPPRSGATEVIVGLPFPYPRRIVYVSCNPGSLARDAAALVHRKGYRLASAGVVDMFPQTSHCEAMAVFERSPAPKADQTRS